MAKIKKRIVIGAVLITVCMIAAGIVYYRSQHVFLDYIYARDVKELDRIDASAAKVSELNRCTELEYLSIEHADDAFFSQMCDFQKLDYLYVIESEIGEKSMERFNTEPALQSMIFSLSTVSLRGFHPPKLMHLLLLNSDISDLEALSECPALRYLDISRTSCGEQLKSSVNAQTHAEIWHLRDSSIFADLDTVRDLTLLRTEILDITGLLDMDALEQLHVDAGCISDAYKDALKEKGVLVTESE